MPTYRLELVRDKRSSLNDQSVDLTVIEAPDNNQAIDEARKFICEMVGADLLSATLKTMSGLTVWSIRREHHPEG